MSTSKVLFEFCLNTELKKTILSLLERGVMGVLCRCSIADKQICHHIFIYQSFTPRMHV